MRVKYSLSNHSLSASLLRYKSQQWLLLLGDCLDLFWKFWVLRPGLLPLTTAYKTWQGCVLSWDRQQIIAIVLDWLLQCPVSLLQQPLSGVFSKQPGPFLPPDGLVSM